MVDLDLKLPQLGFLISKSVRQKSYTERKSKETERIVASDNSIASAMKKRYDIRIDSRKDKSGVKYVKKHEGSPKKNFRKIILIGNPN